MTTTVEIPPEQVKALDRIAAREHTSRDALVQGLIAEFVAKSAIRRAIKRAAVSDIDRFFGLWSDARSTASLIRNGCDRSGEAAP